MHAAHSLERSKQYAHLQGLIRTVGLPDLPPHLIAAIAEKEGPQLLEALEACATDPSNQGNHRAYLVSIITACTAATRKVVTSLGFPSIRTSQLIDLAKAEGASFKNAIRALAREGVTTETASLHQYLVRTLRAVATQEGEMAGASQRPDTPTTAAHTAPWPDPPPAAAESTASKVTPMNRQLQRSRQADADPATSRKFASTHLYGGKAAYCFEADETRKPAATLRIDAAKATAPRQYDWKNKTAFQLTESELPLVFGVLYGFIPRVELLGHGAENEKSLLIEEQGDKFFLSMRVRGGETYAMPAPAKDVFPIMTMLLSQMQKNAPTLPTTELKHLCRRVCEMYASTLNSQRRAANG